MRSTDHSLVYTKHWPVLPTELLVAYLVQKKISIFKREVFNSIVNFCKNIVVIK